ncbi:MAG: hemerythrin domain-containing protein [Bryobacterales bacterium]
MLRDPSLHPLSHQHQHGLALCVILRRTLADDWSEETRRDLAQKVRAAWEIELEPHFAVEESILFPAVKGRIDDPRIVDRLIEEHREIEARIRDLLADPEEHRLRSFAAYLNDHIRCEERELFEQIQEHLNEAELAALGRRLNASLSKACPNTGLPWET